MLKILRSIFCCFPTIEHYNSETSHYRISDKEELPASGPTKNSVRTSEQPSIEPDSVSLPQHNQQGPSCLDSPSNMIASGCADIASVPLEYINLCDEDPAESAMKGHSQTLSCISTSSATTSLGPHSDYSNDQDSPVSDDHSLHKDLENHHLSSANHSTSTAAETSDSGCFTVHASCPSISGQSSVPEIGEIANIDQCPTGNLLPPLHPSLAGRKCLVLDLDETLVHSSFKFTWNADFIIPVEIEGTVQDVYVVKRPGVDEFLAKVTSLYEVVVFTASISVYGAPLLDKLDPKGCVHHRLFRESCYNCHGSYVKNLAWLGRPLPTVVIVDNSPAAYALQPYNAVPVSSWFSDMHDNELIDMIPFLEELSSHSVQDVSTVLRSEW